MIKYEVGSLFPALNDLPGVERCTTQIVGTSFDVIYYISGATKSDLTTFQLNKISFHVWVQEDIPFMAVSYSGSSWTFDFTLTTAGHDLIVVDTLLNEPGNAVNLLLVDARTNTLLSARTLGLPEEFEKLIKDAGRAQLKRYSDASEVLSVINRIYSKTSTKEIIRRGHSYTFNR